MVHSTLQASTPLIESLTLGRVGTRRVWLKMEALQPSGSFKARGISHLCATHVERGARHFVSSSGGNAGLALAFAARKLGVSATVVVPESTRERVRLALAAEGAQVLVHGASWNEAHEQALRLASSALAVYVHPFDDPLLWEGHASLVSEIASVGVEPDAIVLAVGGGGLLSGIAHGLERQRWRHVALLTAETTGTASFASAVAAGHSVELERTSGVATSLGAKRVAERAMEVSRVFPVRPHVVSDLAAVRACLRFADDHRVIVEPACGAALALAYDDHPSLDDYRELVLIVCGGTGATYEELRAMEQQLAR